MAGSGKTTFMQRLNAHLHSRGDPGYIINLDPAVTQLPYGAHVDIRDTVNYKNVMQQYGLGPNGAILTSLNLFATRFDQVGGLGPGRSSQQEQLWQPDGAAVASRSNCRVKGAVDTLLSCTAFPIPTHLRSSPPAGHLPVREGPRPAAQVRGGRHAGAD